MGYRIKDANKWKDNQVPYVFAAEMMKDEHTQYRKLIKKCMAQWEEYINEGKVYVRFVERTNEEKYVEIFPTGDGSTSSGEIGMPNGTADNDKEKERGKFISRFTIRVNQLGGFDHRSSIPHELGHVLGLAHEHQRSRPLKKPGPGATTSGDEVETEDPTQARLYYLGGMLSKETMFAAWDNKYVPVGDYDLQSIMHYPAADGWQWNYPPYALDKTVAIAALNYPSAEQVIAGNWAPSIGDIYAIRELYR